MYLVYRVLIFEVVWFSVWAILSVLREQDKFLEENNLPSTKKR